MDSPAERDTQVTDLDAPDLGPACESERLNWPFPDQLNWEKPYAPPERERLTKAMFEERLAGYEPDVRGRTIWFAPHLQPGNERPYALWASPGEGVELSLFLINVLDSLDEQRAYLSVLVDYEPVEARYVRWIDERGGESEEIVSTGYAFNVEHAGELVDIEIDDSVFTVERTYEVGLMIMMGRPGFAHANVLDRFALFHGGYAWPEVPCYDFGAVLGPTEREAPFIDNINLAFRDGLVLAPGVEEPEQLSVPVRASPGEVIPLELTMLNISTDVVAPAAAIAFLEGKPIGGPWWYRISPDDDVETGSVNSVAYRTSFDLQLPDQPGTYDFHLGMWQDAMIPAQEPDRRPHEHQGRYVRDGGLGAGGISNLVRFVVE